jgi:predicted RNA-binding Zn-ribbon protein involved in translation (DUF1610 family)
MEIILIVGALLGVIPAIIAAKKGRNFFGWWLFGAALFIVALPVAILINPSTAGEKQCPACLNWVARAATKCRHCGTDFRSSSAVGSEPEADYVNPRYATREAIDSWNAAHAGAAEPANKECPQCAETVRFRAKLCRFCGYEFTASLPTI